MLPIKALYDSVIPPLLSSSSSSVFLALFSVFVRAGADAKKRSNKEPNICKHTVINKHILHADLLEMGGGIWKAITAPKLHLGLPAVDHIITDILIDVSKEQGAGGEVVLHLSLTNSPLVIWCEEEAEQTGQPWMLQLCLSAASLTCPLNS